MRIIENSTVEAPENYLLSGRDMLFIPTGIGSNLTIAGWVYFDVSIDILTGQQIENYLLNITDTHQKTYSASETFITEVIDNVV